MNKLNEVPFNLMTEKGELVMTEDPTFIKLKMDTFVGNLVCVSFVQGDEPVRKDFNNTQISVEAILEEHPDNEGLYRVLVSDSTYSYFKLNDIWNIVHNTIEGKRPIIFIK